MRKEPLTDNANALNKIVQVKEGVVPIGKYLPNDRRFFFSEYKISVMTQNDLSGAVVSDKEYPTRVAYSLINKFLEDFIVKHPNWRKSLPHTDGSSSTNSPVPNLVFPELNVYLKKFQNPQEADSIMRVQKELDETKEVLVSFRVRFLDGKMAEFLCFQHKTIESVLRRGEKLDELIEKSSDLSAHSKTLYQVSRKRGCCG